MFPHHIGTRINIRLLRIFAVFALGSLLAGAGAQAQEPINLKLHQFLPAQAVVPRLIIDVWADKIEAESDGRVKIARYASMQLGGTPPELIDQVLDGVVDIAWTVVGYTPGRFPRTEVFELPFIMTDSTATSHAFWDMFEQHMRDTEFRDLHVLGTWVHGPGLLHTRRAVRDLEDLRGMKIRGGSSQVNKLLSLVGATPVGMPVPAIPEALSKGVLDGATVPWEVTPALKLSELVHNHTEFTGRAFYTLTFVLVMNKERYAGLPADVRAVIDRHSGLEFSVFAGTTQAGQDGAARAIAQAAGNTIITLDAEQTALWQQRAEPLYADWAAEMAARGIDGQALIDQARLLIATYGR